MLDQTDTQQLVASVNVVWQPQQIAGVALSRSSDGTSLNISWQANPQLLRYNVYIAAQSGVNLKNYQQLEDGQALLALEANEANFSLLDAAKRYYVLVTGIDGSGESAFAKQLVSEPINQSPNDPPSAEDDNYVIYQNTVLGIAKSSGLLINDSDPNGDELLVNVQPLVPPSSGTLNLESDGSFTFTPPAGFTGVSSFTYEIEDTFSATASAQVNIEVKPIQANLTGDSLSISGEFLYIGLGETTAGSGIGTGRYRIGDCLQIIDTQCSITGDYLERAGSGNQAGTGGTYALTMTYSGTGDSPVIARSTAPGGDSLNFTNLGDALFELNLFPSSGGVIRSIFPDPAFSTLVNFGAFITNPQTCQGLPSGQSCHIGNVGLTAGARETAPLDRLDFIVSGYASVDLSSEPVALDDEYQTAVNQTLSVDAGGVLDNDTDADISPVGDQLNVRHVVSTTLARPIALAVDEFQQRLYVYDGFSNNISVFDRSGQAQGVLSWPGEGANDADLDVAPEALSLANVQVPQGSLLVFNGETATTEIYAIDPRSDTILAQLNTAYGSSHVVGGAYDPTSQAFFLLQDNVPGGTLGNQVAKIDTNTGAVLSTFSINNTPGVFNVSYGDLEINTFTGNIYLVSSVERRIAEFAQNGQFIRYVPLPVEVSSPSGVALNRQADRLWLVNNVGSSPIFELEFANHGKLPGLLASLHVAAQHGTVTLNLDGSFTYIPNTDFSGQDQFVYRVSDQTGKFAQAKVVINVQ
ncbi:MAG: tandem-95 repeat protein [Paraglaciecola sp.]|nr:tandem-95 repeat protein [Paraglaciecola sp.]NCT49742.1 tandem-95 repeat protein [Paraglaciecola sp.]